MFDHVGINVNNVEKSKMFYEQALAVLGMKPLMGEAGEYWGFGKDQPIFWIGKASNERPLSVRSHIAFKAENRSLVDEYYKAAIKAGGTNNGAPGLRPQYHKDFYGAFVLDPNGHNIEVVCHKPE